MKWRLMKWQRRLLRLRSCTLCFHPIQESAFSCNLPDANSHLQRALHVFREAIRKPNATAQRQMLITEMLPKRT